MEAGSNKQTNKLLTDQMAHLDKLLTDQMPHLDKLLTDQMAHLDKLFELGRQYEDVRCGGHEAGGAELLVVDAHLLAPGVERVITVLGQQVAGQAAQTVTTTGWTEITKMKLKIILQYSVFKN